MFFYLIEQRAKFLLHTLQVLYMCTLCDSTGLFEMIVRVLITCHTQYTWDNNICFFYLIEQHAKFLLYTLQVLYMCTLCDSTGLFKMIVGILTTCSKKYTWDSSICVFYLIEQHSQFLLHTLHVLYMCILCDSTNINTIIEFVPNFCSISAVMVSMAVLIRTFSSGILAGRGGTLTWSLT